MTAPDPMHDMASAQPCGSGGREGYCPAFHQTIEMIGRRWTGVIVLQLASGPLQFGAFKDAIPGISDRLLSERLKELEAAEVVSRCRTGREVAYALTERGRDTLPILGAVFDFNDAWEPKPPLPEEVLAQYASPEH